MSTAAIVIVVAVIVVAVVVVAMTLTRRGSGLGTGRLKHRFGPEYERALAHHDGDEKATRDELAQRVKRYGALEVRPLSAQDTERFETRWAAVKTQFVDSPAAAVAEADRLIGQLAEKRGFPGPESPEHHDALSVHHPHQLQGYRQAHTLSGGTGTQGRKATEELRQALVDARGMFESLLGAKPTASAGSATGTPALTKDRAAAGDDRSRDLDARSPEDEADDSGKRRRSPFGNRIGALTGGGSQDDGGDRTH